jgi:RNA polymerase sigma factor (sigma-70 family)
MSSEAQAEATRRDPFERVSKSLVRALTGKFGPQAEDMTQEIIMLALEKYPNVRDEPSLLKLCFTTLTYKKLEEVRRRCRAKAQAAGEGWDPVDSRPGPDRTILDNERYRILEAGVQQLGERCRKIIAMRLDEIPTPRIAETLQIATGTLHTAESRCYQQLREITSRPEFTSRMGKD